MIDLHGVQVTPETWASKDVSYEALAGHRDDPRLEEALSLAADFWNAIDERPVITEWRTCVEIVRTGRD